MKFVTAVLSVVMLAALAGCSKQEAEEPSVTWEEPADTEPAEQDSESPARVTARKSPRQESARASRPAEPTATPEPEPTDVVYSLKGSDFRIENTTGTEGVVGDNFVVGHYFTAHAEFDLPTTATSMVTTLEGKNADGAYPIIGLRVVSTAGPYQSFAEKPRVIEGEQVLEDQFEIGPGSYKLIIAYHTDTAKGNRPHFVLRTVKFKNPDAAEAP